MNIRSARATDARAIAAIHVHSWQHAYRELLPAEALAALSVDERMPMWEHRLAADTNTHTLVAESDDRILGFASWGKDQIGDADDRMLYSIYMAPDAMGLGVGSRLLHQVVADMRADGGRRGTLHVLAENAPTRRFYERHGWVLVPDSDRHEAFFGIEVHTVGYQRSLIEPDT